MLERLWNTITDPLTWSRMWEDFLTVVSKGTPPIYVQYLIATVIFLAYMFFFHDPKRSRIRGTRQWMISVPGLIYSISLVFITAGGLESVSFLLNPDTYYQALMRVKSQIPH